MKLKLLDLFSGIGGFSLGLESTGYFETIAFVEKDKFCQQVLKKNFKNIPIESEVRNVKGDRYAADIITGGFPCQPFSVAGKRKGTDDDRYLWDETIRIIKECKPRWFIGENVEGIINIQEGVVLRQVQDDLEKEGFQVQCLVIPASGIGAWHQRKRVWIIGCNVSNSNKSRSFKEYSSTINRQNKRNGFINESGSRSNENVSNSDNNRSHRQKRDETIKSSNEPKEWLFIGNDKNVSDSTSGRFKKCEPLSQEKNDSSKTCKDVSNTNSFGHRGWSSEGCANEKWSFLSRKQEGREMGSETSRCDVDLSNTNSSRQQECNISKKSNRKINSSWSYVEEQAEQSWWQTQSSLCRVPDGVSYELDKDRTNRIKSLGNSIVPLIARELGLAIMKAEKDG